MNFAFSKMRWKLIYNLVAISALAESYAQIDSEKKNSVGKPERGPIFYIPGQHLPSPAEMLQGYVPPKKTEIPTTNAPTQLPHKTPFLIEEQRPIISLDKSQPDILNNERPKLSAETPEKITTTSVKNNRTPRQFNLDPTTPSAISTSETKSVKESVDTTTTSSLLSTELPTRDSDFVNQRSGPTSPPLPPQYTDHHNSTAIKPLESLVTSEVPSTPLTVDDTESGRYPNSFRKPPPRYPVSSKIPYHDTAFNYPTTKLLTTPPSSKSITSSPSPYDYATSPMFEVTSDLSTTPKSSVSSTFSPPSIYSRPSPPLPPLTSDKKGCEIITAKHIYLPTGSSEYSISSPVTSSPPPPLPLEPNANLNQNSGIYYPARPSRPSLPNTPLSNEPIKDPNVSNPSRSPRVLSDSKQKVTIPSPTLYPLPTAYVTPDTSSDITSSQISSKLTTTHSAFLVNPPTTSITPSHLPITPNPIPTSSVFTMPNPTSIAPTVSPPSLPPSQSLPSHPLPFQITSDISTHKPDVTIIYPDNSILTPSTTTKSVETYPASNIPTEKREPDPIISNNSPSTCVQRYAYLKVEGSSDSYFECQDYQPIHKRCQEGFYYNPNIEWPTYPCDAQEVKNGEKNYEYGPIPSPNGIDKYRMVVNGYYYEMTCPQGLNFNPNNARCDWPLQVSCNSDVSLRFKCPSDGVDESGNPIVTNYKYESSCTLFYSCQAGYARILSCRPGYVFSTTSSRCEKSVKVVCDI